MYIIWIGKEFSGNTVNVLFISMWLTGWHFVYAHKKYKWQTFDGNNNLVSEENVLILPLLSLPSLAPPPPPLSFFPLLLLFLHTIQIISFIQNTVNLNIHKENTSPLKVADISIVLKWSRCNAKIMFHSTHVGLSLISCQFTNSKVIFISISYLQLTEKNDSLVYYVLYRM